MKSLLTQVIAFSLITAATASAQLHDVQFTVTRQKLDEQKQRDVGTTITTKEVRYKVTVQNRSFKEIPELVVKYMIFYEAPQPGSKTEVVEDFHKGSEKLLMLESNRSTSFETKPFELTTEKLDGNYYYVSGAPKKSQDRVAGIWIRAYADGKMVGEYVNPSTIAKKKTFKE